MRISKIISILIIFGILLPSFSFAQQSITPPGTLDEAKKIGERALETAQKEIPGIFERIWKEEVLPVWQKIFNWVKSKIWEPYLWPWFENIQALFGEELEKRKPIIKEEFQKEKQEIKTEAPQLGKSLWERFKELIK